MQIKIIIVILHPKSIVYNIMKGKKIIISALLLTAGTCGANAQLIINELMQSNVECYMDDINEFPDSWVELYNSGNEAVNLKDYKISNKNKEKKAWQLPDKTIASKGYVIIYCDKEGKEDNRLHADFRLESGKGCTVYLFKGKEVVDSLPYIDNKPMVKMPAPDVAFGRKTDGADEWGYQLTPSPAKANTGEICNAKHILGAPVFSELGRVTSGNDAINLELSLPEGAPDGAYITYTTNGSEPTAQSTKYTQSINIAKTKVIRAKVFCDGWLSPMSTAQSYIFHPREFTLPIFSIQTDDRYLNDRKIGLFANNKSKEDKKTHDWRRPVNVEFFPVEGQASAFNQPGETRIQGGQSRSNALKSMVFYANKRFDPDHKRFDYEFFPDQKPGVNQFKSFSLRDGGNDFGELYFRDLIIQRTMGQHVDLDWQAGHSAVLYINGEYMGMLNIRERSNEDNVYSNYNGLEDLDMIEISHEQQNGKDMFIEELKEGTLDFYNAFKDFYSEKGHTKAEYEQWLDVSEYLNVVVLNLFYGNIDFPGNNLVFWRPNEDAKEDLPKRFRAIVKDTDFGLGLYGRSSDYNTIELLYNQNYDRGNAWAFTEPATRLIKNMLEDPELFKMFLDKCCVYMGDFMNAEGTGAVMDAILEEALDEFVAHRDKYNSWGDNYNDILNRFENAKKWLAGYEEKQQGWGGGGWGGWGGWGGGGQETTIVHLPRTDYFLQYLSAQYKLGDAIPVTINKGINDLPDETIINDIKLSKGVFDGKLFVNRQITLEGKTEGEPYVTGWNIEKTASNGAVTTEHVNGAIYSFNMPACKSLAINAVLGDQTGITSVDAKNWKWSVANNMLYVKDVPAGTLVTLYNLQGMQIKQVKADGTTIQMPLMQNEVYILKVGKETIKVK